MSAIKFKVGEPKKVTLAFDQPKIGTNDYGRWFLYGIKSEINSDEDGFFATETLHNMIKTLGAGEGDEITIEKCMDGDISFFKVNGLSVNDMNNGGSAAKVEAAKPNPLKASLEVEADAVIDNIAADLNKLKIEFEMFKKMFEKLENVLDNNKASEKEEEFNVNDIPF